jgi:hypothetical protein
VAGNKQKQGKIKVLFVAADPTSRLMLDEEIREIAQKIRDSEHRDLLTIEYTLAARPDDLLQAFNQHQPHIVHFSGHGSHTGEIILLDNNRQPKPVSTTALQMLFTEVKDNIRVVVLNACYSQKQARAIISSIDCAIGMHPTISDQAAIIFSAAFYRAIGFGRTLQEAYKQGQVALQLQGILEHATPQLLVKNGVDPAQIRIIPSPEESTDNTSKVQLKLIQDALLCRDYRSAFHSIRDILKNGRDDLSSKEQAKLKYLEALIHLEGKRPYSQSPSVMQTVTGLMRMAGTLHPIFSYRAMLAIFNYDFARAGLRKYKVEGDYMLNEAQQLLPLQHEDRENISIFSSAQPSLYRDYYHYLQI